MMASAVALFRPPSPCPCLTKKLTVIGTIGHTHGITSANSPPIAEAIKKGIRPCWAFWAISLITAGFDGSLRVEVVDRVTANAAGADGGSSGLASLRGVLAAFGSAWIG